jgi:hypothetical protein
VWCGYAASCDSAPGIRTLSFFSLIAPLIIVPVCALPHSSRLNCISVHTKYSYLKIPFLFRVRDVYTGALAVWVLLRVQIANLRSLLCRFGFCDGCVKMQDSFKLDGMPEQDIEPRRSPLPLRLSNILDLPSRCGVPFLESDCVEHRSLLLFKKVYSALSRRYCATFHSCYASGTLPVKFLEFGIWM